MDYDLYITFMGHDMGITPIRLSQDGTYELCDACYPLADYIGPDGHADMIERIFAMLPTENGGISKGSFDGLTFEIVESV